MLRHEGAVWIKGEHLPTDVQSNEVAASSRGMQILPFIDSLCHELVLDKYFNIVIKLILLIFDQMINELAFDISFLI